jgi:hypothetical protein
MPRRRLTTWAWRIAALLTTIVASVSFLVFLDFAQSSGHIAWNGLAFLVFLATLFLSIVVWRRLRRPKRRAELGQCPECGYDRRGLATDAKCPECGTLPAK